jgi:hypothetical protein
LTHNYCSSFQAELCDLTDSGERFFLLNEQHCKVHSKFLRFRPSVGALKSTDEHLTVPVTARLANKTLVTLSG